MTDFHLSGILVNEPSLPARCVSNHIHTNGTNLATTATLFIPVYQLQMYMASPDISKLYEPLVSMANIY